MAEHLITGSARHGTIHELLDAFNHAAAKGDLRGYFGCFLDPRARFLGTDKNENWNAQEFFEYAHKYFDGTSAWIYIPLPGRYIKTPTSRFFSSFIFSCYVCILTSTKYT